MQSIETRSFSPEGPPGPVIRIGARTSSLVVEALAPDGSARFRRDETHRLQSDRPGDAISQAHRLGLELGRAVRDEVDGRLERG